jgi:ribosome-associated protein
VANEEERPLTKSAKKTSPSRAKAKPKAAARKAGAKPRTKADTAAKSVAKSVSRAQPDKELVAAQATLKAILAELEDAKAEDTVTIDLEGTSSVADFVVVTTGRSNRQVAAIADRVIDALHKIRVKTKVEGKQTGDWVLVDAGDVILHVFRPEVRAFYNLEKMWTGAAAVRPAG